jgi:2-polyprenyl-3-methyl-5-hydroxy-6-metoxy-1,4-benzoquinol methylase
MRSVVAEPDWPQSWQMSHTADRAEMWGWRANPGHTNYYQERFRRTVSAVRRSVPPGARVLDMAAAQGNFTLALAEAGYHVVWNDLRSELQGYVELKYERGVVEYLPGNLLDLSSEDLAPFDAVLATEVIEHVASPVDFLSALARLCKRDGHIFLTTPNGSHARTGLPTYSAGRHQADLATRQFGPSGDDHLFLFTVDELRTVAGEAGLEIVDSTYAISPVLAGAGWLRVVARLVPARVLRIFDHAARLLPVRLRRRVLLHTFVTLRVTGP